MNPFVKLLDIFIHLLIPKRMREGFDKRVDDTKRVLCANEQLRLFWFIVTFPLVLAFSLVALVIKTLLIWILPADTFSNLSYIFNAFYNDLAKRGFKFSVAVDRANLLWELFTKGAEKRKSYGELNPEITFYVIRPYYFLEPNNLVYRNVANLLTQYYYVLQKLSYAVNMNYVPVIDWEHYGKLPHAEDYAINGSCNSWEYYWTQPSFYTLEEVYKSKNVILSTQNVGEFGYIPGCSMRPPYQRYALGLAERCPQYDQLIRFNPTTEKYINDKYTELFPQNDEKVLGVVVRGSSYGAVGTQNKSHPKQVNIQELINYVRKYMNEWDIHKLFFVNEVQELVELMREEFGDDLIVLPRMRDSLSRKADGITKNPMYEDGQRYQTNLDYVTEIALLSKCDSVMGSMSSGLRTAIIWNAHKYEHIFVIDKGVW